jgi:hypothetical protein
MQANFQKIKAAKITKGHEKKIEKVVGLPVPDQYEPVRRSFTGF